MQSEFSNSLQILQNKLARVLLSADIRTFIDDIITAMNWNKLDRRWKKPLLLLVFTCLKQDAPSYLPSKSVYTSSVHSQNMYDSTFRNGWFGIQFFLKHIV